MKEEVINDVLEAFNGDLKDAVVEAVVTFLNTGATAYDPIAGKVTAPNASVTIRGIEYDTKSSDILNSNINVVVTSFITLIDEFNATEPPRAPDINDLMILDEKRYKIVAVERDPLKVIYIFTIESVRKQ